MRINTAQVRGSEHLGCLHRIVLGHSKVQEHASAKFAQGFDRENFCFNVSHIHRSPARTLRRQGLPAGFRAKGNEEQANGEGDGRQRHGNSQRSVVLYSSANQKRDSRSAKSRKGRGKRESARPAFRRVLLRKPQRVNRKIRATKTKKEKANKKPGKRCCAKIENFSKRQRDEGSHQRKKIPIPRAVRVFPRAAARHANPESGER